MKSWIWRNGLSLAAILLVVLGTTWAVRRLHTPGQMDVLAAQSMDMSAMRPPVGAAPVELASARRGSLGNTVTYTGSVRAYNEQAISPRIAGTLVALSVYPGDPVRAGQVVAQLDTAEVGAKTDQAARQAQEAEAGARIADLNHHLHHQAALDQAEAQVQVAEQGVADAQAEAQAARDAVADADAAIQSASANADYWQTEIAREKQLADAGAASRQEYQNEVAQAQAAFAALTSTRAKARGARAMTAAARSKVQGARRQVQAAQAGRQMAEADIAVAQGQVAQARAGASAAQAAVREAAIVQGYARITSPANGVVIERPVAPGTLVQPGTVLLKIAEIDRVRVQAHVATVDLQGIRPGTPVEITLQGAGGRPIAAKVTSAFPAANDETRTAVVEAVVPNPNHRLLPGGFVTMRIAKQAISDKMLVPASAVLNEGGSSTMWLARSGSNATAHHVGVQTGASDGAWTEIVSGSISAGDRVVTHGQAGLTEGASLVATAWGVSGPEKLPTAAAVMQGATLYRCEKCGMTFSAEDAKKNNYVDPMDGGKLVPIKPSAPVVKPSAPADSMPGMRM